MSSIFSPNKTSARLLVDYAAAYWGPSADGATPESSLRYLAVFDLYIKARSYSIINKITFWFAIVLGVLVLFWPSLATLSKDFFNLELETFQSAVVQTTVTGLAVLTFTIYSHYKKRQMSVENLMRLAVYSDETGPELTKRVLKEMERIDSGFNFSEAFLKKNKADSGTSKSQTVNSDAAANKNNNEKASKPNLKEPEPS